MADIEGKISPHQGQVKGGLKDVFSGFGKKPADKPVEKPDTTATPQ